ncbi:uncharacterized protein LOC144433044 [Glandiceps talaboti]
MNTEAGFSDNIRDDPILSYTVQGIKRQHGEIKRTRLPITLDLMRTLQHQLYTNCDPCFLDRTMLWSAFTLAFFGFLRVSEFTAPTTSTFDQHRTLLSNDITITNHALTVHIKASKTDPFRRGSDIMIAKSDAPICAVNAYQDYRCLKPRGCDHVPAFIFANGNFLTRQSLTENMQRLLRSSGVPNTTCFTTHSFRSRAATTAAKAGLPVWLIKTLGRWHSDCYQRYITTPASVLTTVPRQLVNTDHL